MNDKRTLEDLRNKYKGHIYLCFNDHKEFDDFLVKAESEGYCFGEHMPTEFLGKPWDIISLLDEKQLAFCGTVSHMAYQSGGNNVRRVSYAKFADGQNDYLF